MDHTAPSRIGQLEDIDTHDDWTGLSDPNERRKRQNRLHQRALRRRRAAERDASRLQESSGLRITVFNADSFTPGAPSTKNPTPITSSFGLLDGKEDSASRRSISGSLSIRSSRQRTVIHSLIHSPLIPYLDRKTAKEARPPIVFPLSPDHHLITLAQYNSARGMLTNIAIMALTEILPLRCQSILAIEVLPERPLHLPPALQPTEIQEFIPHQTWIDIIPFPAMRDILILQEGQYDEAELCVDCIGGLHEGFNDIELRGLLAWNDPWSPEGWEVTEGFWNKWGFLLEGCEDLMRATDRWRNGGDWSRWGVVEGVVRDGGAGVWADNISCK